MRSLRLPIALLTLSVTAGCVTPQPRLAKESSPSAAFAYVGAQCKKDTIVRFGFGLLDEQNKEYVVPLENGVALVQIPPGKYHVGYWTTSAALTGERLTRTDYPGNLPVARTFEVGAGQVAFLGKWTADRSIGDGGDTFTLFPVKVLDAEATAAIGEAYPGFTSAPVTCPVCE